MAFSYLPQNEDELELKVGDIIEVVGEVSRCLKKYIYKCSSSISYVC